MARKTTTLFGNPTCVGWNGDMISFLFAIWIIYTILVEYQYFANKIKVESMVEKNHL